MQTWPRSATKLRLRLEEELSMTKDARLRHELGQAMQREPEAAAFYRGQADKLESEV